MLDATGGCGSDADLGGMGYAQQYYDERLLREVLLPRAAAVSPHMILNFHRRKVLELPKSYGSPFLLKDES
jgi:hypothetical protein